MDICAQGFYCLASQPWPAMVPDDAKLGTCDVPAALGSPCLFDRLATQGICAEGSYCDETSTCKALPAPGEACLMYPWPQCAQGYFCDLTVNGGTCTAQAALGEACSESVPCVDEASCLGPIAGAPSTCQKVAEEGEPCTAANTQCAEGTACQEGICVATDALSTFSSLCGQ
jgi:hypothetical protein